MKADSLLSDLHALDGVKSMIFLTDRMVPEIEDALDGVTADLRHIQDAPIVDLAAATALCSTLVSRLKSLAAKDNEFGLTESNMETFAFGLLKSTFKKD